MHEYRPPLQDVTTSSSVQKLYGLVQQLVEPETPGLQAKWIILPFPDGQAEREQVIVHAACIN
jgi:hypothetical protein